MESIQYKKDGIDYSRIIAGCMRWGKWGVSFDAKAYAELIDGCRDVGISTFDNADIYGDYTTEAEFGQGLNLASTSRVDIQLITKCGIRMASSNKPEIKLSHYNHTKSYILACVNQSLINFQTDYIDQLLIHRPSTLMRAEEVAEAFDELLESGKVREFGVSNFTVQQFEYLNEYFPLVTNQLELSPLTLEVFNRGELSYYQAIKTPLQAWSPMGGAQMFKPQSKESDAARIMRFNALCETYDWSLSEMSLLFLLHHPALISPVLGTTKLSRLKEAASCLDKNITDEQWYEIWTASAGHPVP